MPLGTYFCGWEKDHGYVEPKRTFTLKINDDEKRWERSKARRWMPVRPEPQSSQLHLEPPAGLKLTAES